MVLEAIKLVFRGYVGVVLAIVFVLALVGLRKLGYELSSKVIRGAFSVAAPVLSFLVLVAAASNGDLRTAVILGGMVLALAAMLWVLAWMFGAFKKGDTG